MSDIQAGKPDPKALLAAAEQLDRTWDAWATAEDGDQPFVAVEEAIGSMRGVLQGTRRMRLSKDQYAYWRSRCSCGWPGSPWTRRQQAIDEYAGHVCDREG
jgi:hypothetical protein